MAGAHRLGKSAELRELAAEHPDEFVHEVRRGGFTLDDVLDRPGELLSYIRVEVRDPASALHAAIHGWDHPLTYEAMYLLDLIDLTGMANSSKSRKWKPLPRPWKKRGERMGFTDLPPEEAIELLRINARGA